MHTPPHKYHAISLAAIILLVFLAYSNSLTGAWIFDDYPNITQNPYVRIKTLSQLSGVKSFEDSYRRVFALMTFAFNYYFHGMDTVGYHVGNLLIHMTAAICLYMLCFRILKLPRFHQVSDKTVWLASLAAALIWGLSPVHTSAVTYIVQRMTSLAALFCMAAMLFYIKGRMCLQNNRIKPAIAFFAMGAFLLFLGVLTKENAVLLPVGLVLTEFTLITRLSKKHTKTIILTGIVFAIFFSLVLITNVDARTAFSNLNELYKIRQFTLAERVLTQFRVLTHYLSLIILPTPQRLIFDHNFEISQDLFTPPTTILSMLFIVSLLTGGLYCLKKAPLAGFAITWFFLMNVIESTILPLEIIYEHRMYLPTIFLYMLIVVLLFRTFQPKLGRLQ